MLLNMLSNSAAKVNVRDALSREGDQESAGLCETPHGAAGTTLVPPQTVRACLVCNTLSFASVVRRGHDVRWTLRTYGTVNGKHLAISHDMTEHDMTQHIEETLLRSMLRI